MSFFSSLFKHSPHVLIAKAAKKTLPIVLTGGLAGVAGVAGHAMLKNFRGGKKTEQAGISMGQLEASKRVEPISIAGSAPSPKMRIQPIKVNPEIPQTALSVRDPRSTSGSPRMQIMPVLRPPQITARQITTDNGARSPAATVGNRVPVQREYPSATSGASQAATSQ